MIRVFEAFAGYGSQHMALNRLKETYPDFEFKVVGISEIDKYAIQSYNAVHGETKNYGDISKIDWNTVPDFDFFTYSFPCTDISAAGQQKGLEEGSGTRSSLLWECQRAIETKKPKYLMMENVKALTQKKFMPFFEKWLDYLESQNYYNAWQICNARDYGIPQNRERVFCFSVLKTLDEPNPHYDFPEPFPLEKCLADVLEEDVEENFYLSDERIKGLMESTDAEKLAGRGFKFVPKLPEDIANSLTGMCGGGRKTDNFIQENE